MIAVHDDPLAAILLQAKRRRQVDPQLGEPFAQPIGKLGEVTLKRTRLGCLHGLTLVDLFLFVQGVEKRQAFRGTVDDPLQDRRDSSAGERQ